MIKHIFLTLTIFCCLLKGYSQTVFTYGKFAVSKDEFLRAYNKNNTPVTDKEAALREYLELYTKFKLKVQAAREARLDTLQQLQYDLQNFRSQVEENYLQDDKAINALIDEAIENGYITTIIIHYKDLEFENILKQIENITPETFLFLRNIFSGCNL